MKSVSEIWLYRYHEIDQALDNGSSQQALAVKYGVSRERIRQVVIDLGLKSSRRRAKERRLREAALKLTNYIPCGKDCTKCGEWKRFEGFSPDSHGKYGYNAWCKACKSAHQKEKQYWKSEAAVQYRQLERVKRSMAEASKRWEKSHREQVNKTQRAYRKRKLQDPEWGAKYNAGQAKYHRERYANDPEYREKMKAYRRERYNKRRNK